MDFDTSSCEKVSWADYHVHWQRKVLPIVPGRTLDKYVNNGDDMMDIIVADINRYEIMTKREELIALATDLSRDATVLEQIDTGCYMYLI